MLVIEAVEPETPLLHFGSVGHRPRAGDLPAQFGMAAHEGELGLARRMPYLGHVCGERARQVWAAADAFILPSYSEGFSMAVLEALACRLPSLITTACHFPELAAAEGVGLPVVSPA